ncbi:LysR family transcriptional regulator [Acerihabitans arboris]|uniref:LysR family transcriptional regulator n=1 Tax=Acerihabitans arboris TaxID=2691583 RepID=A0A845SA95_9GAMM|nr:LysR family transcriptional regulator [Acerihabitans arboris]NDL61703.1 LysR family transcriptional regulator [Acerihabitans arboris]
MFNHPQIELVWFEDCVALADTLNFSRAAQQRHVTQPAFSRRIQALESWAGTALFERNRRGVRLTAAGEVFNLQAIEFLRSIHSIREKTLEAAGKGLPMITFSATHSLSTLFFPFWLRKSGLSYLYDQVKLVSDTLGACERMFVRGDAQFLLCHYHPDAARELENAQFNSIQVGEDTLMPLCAPDKTGRHPQWAMDDNIKAIPHLAYSADSGLGRIISGSRNLAARLKSMKTVFTSDLAATLLAMARAGDGVAWLPRALAQTDLVNGSLVRAAAGERHLEVPVQIRVFRPAAMMTSAAEQLWDAIAAQNTLYP